MNAINPFYNPYSEHEKSILRLAWGDNRTDIEMCELLTLSGFSRTADSIKAQRSRMRLVRDRSGWNKSKESISESFVSARDMRIAADNTFKRAMLAAIKAGTEIAILGVVKDRRPLLLKTYHPEPMQSLCSSSASWGDRSTDDGRQPSELY